MPRDRERRSHARDRHREDVTPGRSPGRAKAAALSLTAAAVLASLIAPAAAYPRPGTTERVSVSSGGDSGDGGSSVSAMSSDGRYIAFVSDASTLVPGDTNAKDDVFLHDRETGVTERVSVASDGTQGNGHSGQADVAISADGRYVGFWSRANNLIPGDTNLTDVFVHDRVTGVTERVSVASDGTPGNQESTFLDLSADGRYVAFQSRAWNLVPGDTNSYGNQLQGSDIFVHDRTTHTTKRVSVAADGTEGNSESSNPSISADGRYVAFQSQASTLIPNDINGTGGVVPAQYTYQASLYDVFVHDRQTGGIERVSVASDGSEGIGTSTYPDISADGRYVAFESEAFNLVPADTNGTAWTSSFSAPPVSVPQTLDVFVHDRETGVTERVSVASDGAQGNGPSRRVDPAISDDGRYVAFQSGSALVPGDTNGAVDIFVHDRETGATEWVSVSSDGAQGIGSSGEVAISADGRSVAFWSVSPLAPDDDNGEADIFVRDRGPSVGTGAIEAAVSSETVSVQGWARLEGAVLAKVDDQAGDFTGVDELGADLRSAALVLRPEESDLLVRLRLESLPPGALLAGQPGVLYGLTFNLGSVRYEVRASGSQIVLYSCSPACSEVSTLAGSIGTTGPEVRVSVPLTAVGAGSSGATLTDVSAYTALGTVALGTARLLDDATISNDQLLLPAFGVHLGIAPVGTPEKDVTFDTEAALQNGRFSGIVPTAALPPGKHRVWARSCLGSDCTSQSAEVTL